MAASSRKSGKRADQPKTCKRSDKNFRALIENSFDVIVLQNERGDILYASPSITRILGYTPDELVGVNGAYVVHPEDKKYSIETFNRLLVEPDTQIAACFRVRHKDGSWRVVEGVWKNLLDNPDINAIVINLHDITEHQQVIQAHKQLVEQLEAERTLLREILRQMPSGVVVADASTGNIILSNERVKELIHSDILPLQAGQYTQGTTYHLDGSPMQAYEWSLLRAMQGEVAQNEERLYIRKDGTQCYFNINATPIRDKNGNIIAALVSFYDITLRKELDKRKDEFISLASHELKTPLTSLKGFTYLLTRHLRQQNDQNALYFLLRMDSQINKLTRLVNDLLDVSRLQTGKMLYRKEVFALHELVKEIVENVQGTTQTHSLIVEPLPVVHIEADRDRIGQVLVNLLSNAIKYSPLANKVTVRMAIDGDYVTVSVQDFGPGIAPEHHQQIFERFYQVSPTTQHNYPGLGIGLYISNQIIKEHQGKLWLESEPGQGATFHFSLPTLREENVLDKNR